MMFAAALILSLPAVTAPSSVAGVAQIDPARRAAGLTLARSVRSEAYALAESAQLFKGAFAEELAKNPDIAQLETEYPGITAAMIDAARPLIERLIVKSLPDLWNVMADIYASAMTVAEIEQARAYYESPPGRRFLELTIASMDLRPFASRIAADPESGISTSDLRGLQVSGVVSAVARLTPAERAALLEFSKTPAFARIRVINPRISQAVVTWSNARNPQADAEVEQVMAQAIERFVEAADRKKEERR